MSSRKPKLLTKKSVEAIFAERRAELLKKLSRIELRKKEGWRYKKIWRKSHSVPAHRVRAHYAIVPVKRK
jgi:hypothetical protein